MKLGQTSQVIESPDKLVGYGKQSPAQYRPLTIAVRNVSLHSCRMWRVGGEGGGPHALGGGGGPHAPVYS